MGCVALSASYFARRQALGQALRARARSPRARSSSPCRRRSVKRGWDHAAGSSGTVRAIARSAAARSIRRPPPSRAEGIERAASTTLIEAGHIERDPAARRDGRPAHRVRRRRSRSSPRSSTQLEVEQMRIGGRRDARGPALRHGGPLHRRGRARAHGALDAAALSRRPRAGRARRSRPRSSCSRRCGRPGELARSARRAGAGLGRAPARDRPRRLAQRLSPPRRLPAARTPTCRASRARSRRCWRAWSALIGASWCSTASRSSIPPWDERAMYLILILRLAVLLHRDRSDDAAARDRAAAAQPRTLELRVSASARSGPPAHRRRPATGDRVPARAAASGCACSTSKH